MKSSVPCLALTFSQLLSRRVLVTAAFLKLPCALEAPVASGIRAKRSWVMDVGQDLFPRLLSFASHNSASFQNSALLPVHTWQSGTFPWPVTWEGSEHTQELGRAFREKNAAFGERKEEWRWYWFIQFGFGIGYWKNKVTFDPKTEV